MYLLAATSQGYVHPPTSPLSATTIFQLLDNAGVTWKIYSVDTGSDGKLITFLRNFQPYGLNQESRIVPIAQFFTDLQNGTLPQFAYIEPAYTDGRDEHPADPRAPEPGYRENHQGSQADSDRKARKDDSSAGRLHCGDDGSGVV